ncbi:hypothetical protein IT575_10000 [bacterium]|nr:hypothetical protein [bacterium]
MWFHSRYSLTKPRAIIQSLLALALIGTVAAAILWHYNTLLKRDYPIRNLETLGSILEFTYEGPFPLKSIHLVRLDQDLGPGFSNKISTIDDNVEFEGLDGCEIVFSVLDPEPVGKRVPFPRILSNSMEYDYRIPAAPSSPAGFTYLFIQRNSWQVNCFKLTD